MHDLLLSSSQASSTSLSSSSSSSSKAKKIAKKTPKDKAYTQTFLDFGQRSLGKRTLCNVCGFLYVNGQAEDEKDHAVFCRSVNAGLNFPGWKDERLVKPTAATASLEGRKDRIIEVRPGDGVSQMQKMSEIKRIMDQEMGFVPLAEGENPLKVFEKAFLYIRDKKVVGCVVVEKISSAYPVIGGGEQMVNLSEELSSPVSVGLEGKENQREERAGGHEQLASFEKEGKKFKREKGSSIASDLLPSSGVAYLTVSQVEATLGVKQIWVSKNCRRQGLAKTMVDIARARFYYGCCVGRDKTAFSQLSTAGYAFATSYMKEQANLLVY